MDCCSTAHHANSHQYETVPTKSEGEALARAIESAIPLRTIVGDSSKGARGKRNELKICPEITLRIG
jgi:hypothetical protein